MTTGAFYEFWRRVPSTRRWENTLVTTGDREKAADIKRQLQEQGDEIRVDWIDVHRVKGVL